MFKFKVKLKGKVLNWLVKEEYVAITIAPFGVYLNKRYYGAYIKGGPDYEAALSVINHEHIHWKQQMEMGILPFYLWYIVEWLLKGCNYYDISFENEAYLHGDDMNYISNRKPYAWFKYIKGGKLW